LDDVSTYALPMAHLETLTPTAVFFGVATRDTNSPPDMTMQWFAKLSEPQEVVFVDADHYQLIGAGRDVLHPKEVAFLKEGAELVGQPGRGSPVGVECR
jgi:predicted pyridoxine 5'-phosphate oxidase superfamily flavin-nucleotide-binding protein